MSLTYQLLKRSTLITLLWSQSSLLIILTEQKRIFIDTCVCHVGSRISLNIIWWCLFLHATIVWGCTFGFMRSESDERMHSWLQAVTGACMSQKSTFQYMFMKKDGCSPQCLRVHVCFRGPAASLSKFKLSCGNVSLPLQSSCVTWWTDSAAFTASALCNAPSAQVGTATNL